MKRERAFEVIEGIKERILDQNGLYIVTEAYETGTYSTTDCEFIPTIDVTICIAKNPMFRGSEEKWMNGLREMYCRRRHQYGCTDEQALEEGFQRIEKDIRNRNSYIRITRVFGHIPKPDKATVLKSARNAPVTSMKDAESVLETCAPGAWEYVKNKFVRICANCGYCGYAQFTGTPTCRRWQIQNPNPCKDWYARGEK